MRQILLIALAAFVSESVSAQGTVRFNNIQSARPIFLEDGTTPVPPFQGFKAALYFAPAGVTDESTFTLLGEPVDIFGGFFSGLTRTAPVDPPGSTANFQVRAWQSSFGETYEEANVVGALIGESNILTIDTSNPTLVPPEFPAQLVANGLNSFSLYTVVPEPSVFALGALGAGAMLLLRRRK